MIRKANMGRAAVKVALFAFVPLGAGCGSSASFPGAQAPMAATAPEPARGMSAPSSQPSDASTQPAAEKAATSPAPAVKPAAGGPAVVPGSPIKAKSNGPKLDDAQKPLLVYESALGIQVHKADVASAIEHAIDVGEGSGGYLVSRSDSGVVLRVPSQQLRATLKALEELGSVTRRSVTAQDVSEEFHDLGVRLKNLESVRDRLEQFLGRAANVDEALRVGKELEAVVRQIDEAKGRMQFLKTRAAYSLINVSFEPKSEAPVIVKHDPPPAPAPRPLRMPVGWLKSVGLGKLLALD